jgi:AcrR family transcriptional regulator
MMARTVDTAAHAVRREAFVDAALRLIQAKGYDHTTVQDVLDEAEASRGAFYHYFDSKTALLDAVVARIVDAALTSAEPIVHDADVGAVAKLEGLYDGVAQWKMERTELMLAITGVWLSDENALTRDKMWRHVTERFSPLLAQVIRQGNEEGVFSVASPEDTARVMVAIMPGMNEAAVRAFVDHAPGEATLQAVKAMVAAYEDALERILGVSSGTLRLIDGSVLEEWFA